MAWLRLDDQIGSHPKTIAAENEAFGAWVRMDAHACAYLTDGFITTAVALHIAVRQDVIDRLVAVGYLDVAEGGYLVHDFHDWNPRAADVKAKREDERARKDAARKKQGRDARGRIVSAPCPDVVRADSERTAQVVRPDSARIPEGVRPESENCPPVPSPVSRLPSPVGLSKETAREVAPHPDALVAVLSTSAELAEEGVDLARLARTLRSDTIGGGWGEKRIVECLPHALDVLARSKSPGWNPHAFVVQVVRRLAKPGALEIETKAQGIKTHWRTERAAGVVEKYQASKGESSEGFAASAVADMEKAEREARERSRRGTGETSGETLFGRKGAA